MSTKKHCPANLAKEFARLCQCIQSPLHLRLLDTKLCQHVRNELHVERPVLLLNIIEDSIFCLHKLRVEYQAWDTLGYRPVTERQSPTISDQVERLVHSEPGKGVDSAQPQQMPAAADMR